MAVIDVAELNVTPVAAAPPTVTVAPLTKSLPMIVTLVPFFSNGLGLREWAIGLAAPLLTVYQLEHGITAELVNRAGELIVVLIAGLVGIAYLTHLRRKSRAE